MGINTNIFEKGNISKLLLKFAVPAIIALLVSELYNMSDTVYAARFLGPDAIAALTVAFPVQKLLTALGLLAAAGGSTYAARSFGEKNIYELKKIIIASLSLVIVLLTAVSCLLFIFRTSILYSLGASKTTLPLAQTYVSRIIFGGIFQSMSVVACYIMVSLGKTRATLYANLVGVVLNISINEIVFAVLGTGSSGLGIATVISQTAVFIYACYEFRAVVYNLNIKLSVKSVSESINAEIMREIVTVGFSTFVIEFADAAVAVVLNNILSRQGGDSAIVMAGIITKISMFMFITIIGISSAMQPVIAYNYGAENFDRVKKVLFASIKAVMTTSIILWTVLMIFAKPIIGFLLKDTVLLDDTVRAFRTCILLLPLVGVYYIGIYYCQAVGEAKKGFLLSIYRETVIFIPMSILFVQLFGIKGVWAAYPVTDALVSVTSLYLLSRDLVGELRALKAVHQM